MDRADLLQPVFAGYERRPARYKPWRPGSQIYVGFFGGALAVGVIAFANSIMLGMSRRARIAIAGLAVAAEAALLVAAAFSGPGLVRIGSLLAGLIVYGGAYLLQRSPDRVYHFHTDEDEPYESLFGAGLVACILGRIVDTSLAYAVAG